MPNNPQGIVWDDAPQGVIWDDEKPTKKSVLQRTLDYATGAVNGPLEAGAQMVTGDIGQALGGLTGLGTVLTGGGLDKAVERSGKVAHALTYEPQTQAGRDVSAAIALPFEKANEGLGWVGGKVGKVLGNEAAGQTIGENILPAALTVAPVPKLLRTARASAEGAAAAKQLALESGARKNAAALDALAAAEQEGIATNPATTNPTRMNRMRQALAGKKETDAAIAKHNEELWTPIIKRELGVHADAPLDMTTLRAVREAAAAPNAEVGQLGNFFADESTIRNIRNLREAESPFGAEAATHSTNSLVNRVLSSLGKDEEGFVEGRDAGQLLKDISVLRNDAQLVFTNKTASPEAVAGARTRLKITNELEGMVDANLTRLHEANPYGGLDTLLNRYREGRARSAKSYATERVLDLNTGKISPLDIAKMTAEDNALTGGFANIGKVAGVMPEVVTPVTQDMSGLVKQHFYRSRPGAMLGTALGGAMGGLPGGAVGALVGATASDILGDVLAKRATGATAQALRRPKGITEEMWRPYADLPSSERLTDRPPRPSPVERMLTGTEVVPYGRPNWRMYRGGEQPPTVPGPAQLPEFSAEQVMDVVGKQRAWDYGSEAIKDAAAEAAAYADALRNRKPASGGIVIGEQSPKGAELPKASALDRAVEKLSAGRAFDLTAEERIAWNKASGGIHAPQ